MKDVFDAVSARIKAPYVGYAVLAFLALNWRAIFMLAMTQGTPEQRLAAFDMHTTLWSLSIAPLLTGVIVAVSSEWIRYGFEWTARKPRYRMAVMDLEAEEKKITKKLELQAKRQEIDTREEEKLIEQAKREDKAVQDIESEEVKRRLQDVLEKRRAEKDSTSDIVASLNEQESEMLIAAAKARDGSILKVGYLSGDVIKIAHRSYGTASSRDLARYVSALKSLESKELVEQKGSDGTFFQLTAMGWDVAEKLS